MPRDDLMPVRLLEQARGGDEAARGGLLELYRNYLRLVARSLISTLVYHVRSGETPVVDPIFRIGGLEGASETMSLAVFQKKRLPAFYRDTIWVEEKSHDVFGGHELCRAGHPRSRRNPCAPCSRRGRRPG